MQDPWRTQHIKKRQKHQTQGKVQNYNTPPHQEEKEDIQSQSMEMDIQQETESRPLSPAL